MNCLQPRHTLLLLALACMVLATYGWAQETRTEVRRGEVVYVSGNDLVVKMEDGQVKHFVVPAGKTFNVDGRELTLGELKPGTKLTQTISTTQTPTTVSTVRTISGTVWHAAGKNVILTLPNGENKQYKVPDGTKFNIGGEEKTVFDLRKGMKVTATVVTTTPEIVVSEQRSVSGQAPVPLPRPAPVPLQGALLVEEAPTPPARQVAAAAPTPEPAPTRLPKTATDLPLMGLMGIWLVAIACGLRAIRNLTGPNF